ncbi:MAG: TIGR02281 family clan AA aspartic protease [Granulosicoccaceae bacterium]|jgi:aspartyl protease family protein
MAMGERQAEQDFTRRIGKRFVLLAWLLVFGLLVWLFAGIEKSQRNPNTEPTSARDHNGQYSVVLKRNRFGHYVTTGHINGTEVTFLLDTGASDVSIPAPLADQLGLQRGPEQLYSTANGLITGYLTRVNSIRIGNIELRDVQASINPNNTDNEILLGMSFLRRLNFTQRGDQLILSTTTR